MARDDWPERWCDCEIIFRDGEVKTHTLKASTSLTSYLAHQAGDTGQLVLLCGPETFSYPLDQIHVWSLKNERDQRDNGGGK